MSVVGRVKSSVLRGVMDVEWTFRGRATQRPLSEIKNFLLLQHATALGSVVHATPLVAALRKTVPGCRIVVATSGIGAEIYSHNPEIDLMIETPSPLQDFLGAVAALRRLDFVRTREFATITSTGNERTLIALQAGLGRAGNCVGFTVAPELYRAPLRFDATRSQIANNLRIVGALGHDPALTPDMLEPRVFFSDDDRQFAERILVEARVHPGQLVAVFVTQTSVTQRKSWRAERFRAAAKFLHERYGARIVFVGTASDTAAIDKLRDGLAFLTTNVAGKTSLTQLTALLSRCDVGLTLDTGTMHLGRAVGLPMVIIAPAWSPAVEWLPLGDPRFSVLKNLEMSAATPDYLIDEVSVDEVKQALVDLISRYSQQV